MSTSIDPCPNCGETDCRVKSDPETLAQILFNDDLTNVDMILIRDGSEAVASWLASAEQAGDQLTRCSILQTGEDEVAEAWDVLVRKHFGGEEN